MERLTFKTERGVTTVYAEDWRKAIDKLAEYEDAEEQGRILISEREIDDWLYAIVHDDNFHCYDISEHRITDICLSGTIITNAPAGDDMAEVWTKEMQKEYHVCFSLEEAEAKRQELQEEEDHA